jgi:hypothetical protein
VLEPDSVTRGSSPASRMSTANDACRGPSPVGVKTTVALHDSPAGISRFLHVLEVTRKSDRLAPDVSKRSRCTGPLPSLRAAMVCASLDWLSATAGNDRAV